MSNFFKKILNFRTKEQSDDQLVEMWVNSNKTLNDFENTILKIKNIEKKCDYVIKEGSNVKSYTTSISNFLNSMNRIYVGHKHYYMTNNQHNSKSFKRLLELLRQVELYQGLYNIVEAYDTPGEQDQVDEGKFNLDLNLLFKSNKFENLSMIVNELALINNDSLKNKIKYYIFDFYFNSTQEYYKSMEYFLLKSQDETESVEVKSKYLETLRFILPSIENVKIFLTKKLIPIEINISNLFTHNLETSDKFFISNQPSILDLNLNNLIHLNSDSFKLDNQMRLKYTNLILNLIQDSTNDYKLLKFLFDLYSMYLDLLKLVNHFNTQNETKEKTFSQFIQQDLFSSFDEQLFTNLNKISKETFEDRIQKLFTFHRENSSTIKNCRVENLSRLFENFLIVIYIQILSLKSPIQFLSIYLQNLFGYYQDDPKLMKTIIGLTLKLLIENLSDSYQNNLLLLEILINNNHVLHCDILIDELRYKINFIEVLDKNKIPLSLNDLMKNELLLVNNLQFKQCELYKIFFELFNRITKNFRKSENLKFLEINKEIFDIIRKYLKSINDNLIEENRISFIQMIFEFLKDSQSYEKILAKIIIENFSFFQTQEIIFLLEDFLKLRNKIKENENLIVDYLEDIKNILKFLNENQININSDIIKKFSLKMKNLLRLFAIAKVFSSNQIKSEFLFEFDYEKLNLNLANILEIFIMRKFNIDLIEDINIFLDRTKDIFDALEIDKAEYLFNTFIVFLKCQNIKFCVSLMKRLIEMKSYKFFEKCLKMIKNQANPDIKFNQFMIENDFSSYVLEKTDNLNLFEEIYPAINFSKEKKLNLNTKSETEDILMIINLDRNGKDLADEPIELQIYKKNKSQVVNDNVRNFTNFLNVFNNPGEFQFDKASAKNRDKLDKKKINFKYSFHPGLNEILNKLNYNYRGKEFEFNTKISFKTKLYKILIEKKIVTSLDKILEFENFDKKRSLEDTVQSYSELFDLLKLLINLYDENSLQIFEDYEIFPKLKIIIDNLLIKKGADRMRNLPIELFAFNMQNIRYVNSFHLTFLKNVFGNLKNNELNLFKNSGDDTSYFDEEKSFLIDMLNSLTRSKLCILPFLSYDDFYSLIQFKSFKDSIKAYYDDIIANIKYFTSGYNNIVLVRNKSANKNENEEKKLKNIYGLVEIYKHVNLHNFVNVHKIFSQLDKTDLNQIIILLVIKLCVNAQNILIVSMGKLYYKSSIREIIEMIKNLLTPLFAEDEESFKEVIKILCFEICNFPNINFILEPHMSISLLNKNTSTILKNLLLVKMILMEEIASGFNKLVDRNYIIYDKYKILKIKNYIIQNLPEDEVISTYEKLKSLNEFNDIKHSLAQHDRIIREIEKIYSEI